MKKFAVALLFCGVSAFAGTVSYTTTGVFNPPTPTTPGTTTAALSQGGDVLTFTGASGTLGTPAGTQIGTFTLASVGTGTFSDNFTLWISSNGGTSSFDTPVSGTITTNSGIVTLSFTPTSAVIGGNLWTLSGLPITLNDPSVAGGITTLQAVVTAPEPASLGLLGASLAGLGIAFRRRRAA